MPLSHCNNISFKNIKMDCGVFFNVQGSDKFRLNDFSFEDIDCQDHGKTKPFSERPIENLTLKNVVINGEKIQ
jgi:hypothetical protein